MWLRQMSLITGTALAALLATPALAQEQKPVRLLMNWFAQPDQSGFWQAQIDDAGKDKGLKIIDHPGRPKDPDHSAGGRGSGRVRREQRR